MELDDRSLNLVSDLEDDARIIARLLQGWMPQDLGLERAYGLRTAVLATLPGGNRPEVQADGVERFARWDGVPVLGFDETYPQMLVAISFSRSRVQWSYEDELFEFARSAYDRAVGELLTLVGEAPVLVSDEEWVASTPTRVVPSEEARRITRGW